MEIKELKKLFSAEAVEADIRFLEPMRGHTSLRIGGEADVFVSPYDLRSLCNLIKVSRSKGIPVLPVGGGTNLLVRDRGIEGVVLSLAVFNSISVLSESADDVFIYADAGVPLPKLVEFSRKHGLSGLEGLSGIPGYLGGAIAGNAGAFGYEIKDTIVSVSVVDFSGSEKKLEREEIDFSYRSAGIPEGSIILGAELRLKKDEPEAVSERISGFLKEKKTRQPLGERSAGCVFKNPEGYQAGRLIDEAGCKGMKQGDIEVSSIHANFFVNKGKGSAEDFLRLMDKVASRVKEKFGIVLEPEIRIVGRC
jgi:UDP-N-acetylmuramate dehydrogenase